MLHAMMRMNLEQRLSTILSMVWIVYLCYALTVFLEPPPAPRLYTPKLVEYIELHRSQRHGPVDAVLLAPCIYGKDPDGKTVNLSMISILRFAPWINRIHVQMTADTLVTDKVDLKEPSLENWNEHKQHRLVYFKGPLLEYTTTTPFLAERFFALKPDCALTNYLFSWQLFIGESPVGRSSYNAVCALTRTSYNELAFAKRVSADDDETLLDVATRMSLRRKETKWLNNVDHFVPPCASTPFKTVTYFPNDKSDRGTKVTQALHYVQPKKVVFHDKPTNAVVCVVDDTSIDMMMEAPGEETTIQIWVLIGKVSPPDHLSFIHRQLVRRNLYMCTGKKAETEATGALIMQKVRDFPVLPSAVYCVPSTRTLSTKLAQAYDVAIKDLSLASTAVLDSDETKRLKLL